jgi:hypothetical protein
MKYEYDLQYYESTSLPQYLAVHPVAKSKIRLLKKHHCEYSKIFKLHRTLLAIVWRMHIRIKVCVYIVTVAYYLRLVRFIVGL